MKRLSKVVNIVPVIAKADTLTLEERVYFKQRVGLSTFLLAGAVRHSTPGFSWRRKIRNGWSPPAGAGGRTSLPCCVAPLRAAVEQEDAPWAAASTRPDVRTTWRTEAPGPRRASTPVGVSEEALRSNPPGSTGPDAGDFPSMLREGLSPVAVSAGGRRKEKAP